MDDPSPSMRELAQRLLAASRRASAEQADDGNPRAHEAVAVCEMLRASLTKFTGADGFAALLRRALALASAEVPALKVVKVGADGQLEGFDRLAVLKGVHGGDSAAALAITTRLLQIMVAFIGEPLTLVLVNEAWGERTLDEEQ